MRPTVVYWLPAVATAGLIAWLSHRPELPDILGPFQVPDKIAHFLEYGFFTLTLVFATSRGFEEATRTPTRAAVAVVIASAYGITDEWHQSFVATRDATVGDWVADTAGALVMAALILALWRRMAVQQPHV